MFGALVKFAVTEPVPQGQYGRTTLFVAGTSGLLTTILGIALVFFPAQQITSLFWYEIWMVGGTLFFVGLAAFFFFVYGRRKSCAQKHWDRRMTCSRSQVGDRNAGKGTASARAVMSR